MSHSTKPPAKLGTPGSEGKLATARTHSTAGKPVTAGPPATACSKGTAETPTTPMVTPGTSAIAERPAPGNHQELKGRNILTAHNSRNASNSRNESNNRTANTVWKLSKAGILAKTVKPATA
jgi:hypothetical protein